jgi:hypothetical protein
MPRKRVLLMRPPALAGKALLQVSISSPSSSRPTSIPTVLSQDVPDAVGREAEAGGEIGGALTLLEPARDLLRTCPALPPGIALRSLCGSSSRHRIHLPFMFAGVILFTTQDVSRYYPLRIFSGERLYMDSNETNPSWRELSRLAVKSLWRETAGGWLVAGTCFAALWLA